MKRQFVFHPANGMPCVDIAMISEPIAPPAAEP